MNWGIHNPLLGFNNLLDWLTELRKTLLYVYYIIKAMIKYTDEQSDKEIHRAKTDRVPSSGAFVL